MNEIWKDIKGFEGKYQVSNLGRVRSLDRYVNPLHPYLKMGQIIRQRVRGKYFIVSISDGHRNYSHFKVHRLVALHFVEGYKKGLIVNHKDENKLNNRADNLEWCTYQYNLNYSDVIAWKRKAVYQYDLEGNFIAKHKCCAEVERMMGTYQGAMVHVMYESKRGVWKGYRWSFEPRTKEYWMQHDQKENRRRHAVIQLDPEGNIIQKFMSIKDAVNATGIRSATISSSCRKKSNMQKTGYLWRYAE